MLPLQIYFTKIASIKKEAAMKIPLTPGQAVTIHGWMNPKETLSWMDVLANPMLSFKFLTHNTMIPKELLHKLQPDIKSWVKAGRISLPETPELLSIWVAHPIKDLNVDFGDIVELKWDAKTMKNAGVTYADLKDAGMTHDTMGLFGYTLYEWSQLGLSKTDAEAIPAHALGRLFRLTKGDVLRCLK